MLTHLPLIYAPLLHLMRFDTLIIVCVSTFHFFSKSLQENMNGIYYPFGTSSKVGWKPLLLLKNSRVKEPTCEDDMYNFYVVGFILDISDFLTI